MDDRRLVGSFCRSSGPYYTRNLLHASREEIFGAEDDQWLNETFFLNNSEVILGDSLQAIIRGNRMFCAVIHQVLNAKSFHLAAA